MEGGRFCLHCQHKVTDFTGWSRDELVAWFKHKPETCGQFEPHQIDPSLLPLEEAGQRVRHGLLASLLALSMNSGLAQERPAPAATEQVVPTSVPEPAIYPIQAIAPDTGIEDQADSATATPAHRKEPTHRIYISKRFPFIHVKQQNWRGRARRQDIIF